MLHPVSDLATAKEVYAVLLGVPAQTDEPYYVRFDAAGQHIGLVPGGGPFRPEQREGHCRDRLADGKVVLYEPTRAEVRVWRSDVKPQRVGRLEP